MTALNLFPARVRFVNNDGTLTNEAYRALQIVFGRVGGALGDSGTDVFGQAFGAPTDSDNNLSNALSDVVQPVNFGSDYYGDVTQFPTLDTAFPDVVQPFPINQTGFGQTYVMDASPTLVTPTVTSTLGIGNATPSTSGIGVTFPSAQSLSSNVNTLDDYREGTFTATATGMTTSPTGTVTYVRVGNVVSMYLPSITGTSNSTSFTLTGMPAEIRPSASRQFICATQDNGASYVASSCNVSAAGVITLGRDAGGNVFTAAGTKSIAQYCVTYII